MSQCRRLGLGTAQWGMTYGIANRSGGPTAASVTEMLQLARERGIAVLDTAWSYRESESIVGELSHPFEDEFQIVTKIRPLRSAVISESEVSTVMAEFAASLERLRCQRVYGLLVHRTTDLLAAGSHRLWAALQTLKTGGTVSKIGVSVYHPEQLEAILARYPVDLVQLPVNVYDQRFARTGLLARLKRANVEVHARSAFLQGLLLMTVEDLPEYFSPIRDHHASFCTRDREIGVSPLTACLHFCLAQSGIDKVIVGCDSFNQLTEVVAAADARLSTGSALEAAALGELRSIDPSRWQKSEPEITASKC